jgi:toxin YoeB
MNISFTVNGWIDYTFWQNQDKKTVTKTNKIIADVMRGGNAGIGKPEALRGDMSGWWSRRIDSKNRLVYRILDENIEIYGCRDHYDDK